MQFCDISYQALSRVSISGILMADGTFKEFSFLSGLIVFPVVYLENDGNTHPIYYYSKESIST